MELDDDISMGDFDSNAHESIALSNDTPSFNMATNGHEGSLEPPSFIDTYDTDELNMPIQESGEQPATQNGSATTPPHKLSIVEAGDAIVESEETPTPTQTSDSIMSGDFTPNDIKPEVIIRRAPDPVLPYSSSRTGLVYDARMRFHTELGSVADDDIHPEDPRRIWEIFHELVVNGLVEPDTVPEEVASNASYHPQRLFRIPARLAEPGEICLVHTVQHYEWVESLSEFSELELRRKGKAMDSVYLHPLTHYCARLSAGGAIEACRSVVGGVIKNAIAVIRPPGHHAEHNEPGGFCFFNNVCVATRVCQADFPDLCRKVLILDWDVHHGNGIQNIFEDDPNVLYISLHVHRDGRFYPQGPAGDYKHVGIGDGVGKNINIPWPQHFMGDGDYMHAFQQVVMPVAQEFNPDLVIIAAGFDAAEGDTLGMCLVTPAGFAHMTHMLMSLADGKVVACLEGGYNLRSIAKSALSVARTLMGEPPPRLHDAEPSLAGVATVKTVISEHSKYWKCLYPKESPGMRLDRMGGERMHDILRERQASKWFDSYRMSSLYILRDQLSQSFSYQVLATYDYDQKKPLLVILHDPPETLGIYDSMATSLEPHNIIATDPSEPFIKDAVENGFAVIDVNIPKHITNQAGTNGETNGADISSSSANELVSYLWENYIEINSTSHIFLLGIGSAASSLVYLLNTHERTSDLVKFTFSFISEQGLVGVNRPADDYFPAWYYAHSAVFVAENHPVWSPERQRKQRKKYGHLIKSEAFNLNDMLVQHHGQVFEKLLEESAEWNSEGVNKGIETPVPKMETDALAIGTDIYPSDPMDSLVASSQLPTIKDERSSPHRLTASPNPMKSPSRMPPLGTFTVTTPDRGG